MNDTNIPVAVALICGGVGVFVLLYCLFCKKNGGKQPAKTRKKSRTKSSSDPPPSPSKQNEKKGKGSFKFPIKKGGLMPHPLSAADFKGHTDTINDIAFELGGKYLVSCSQDRTVRLWPMKTVSEKEHKHTRLNIEDSDIGTNVAFSPDGTAVLMTTAHSNDVIVYKIMKSKGNLSLTNALSFPLTDETKDESVLSLEIAPSGKFIMSCSETSFTLWTVKGVKLCTVETKQSPNNMATISHCSKFIACCGFTTDVKIWEVVYSKSDEFQSVNRAMDLKGHLAGVVSVSFSQDSKKALTLSKDITFKLWNIDVSYSLNEDPRVLLDISLSVSIPIDINSKDISTIALSPDSLVIAVAIGHSIYVFDSIIGSLLESFVDVHNAVITRLLFDPSGQYIVSSGGSDKFIRLWHNTPGMKEQLRDLKLQISSTGSEAMKVRLRSQMDEIEKKLKDLPSS
ncbi:PREDICTED: transducin beta-like protein 2 [Amphimedon queenslandica]|uniref:Uncharacterized protein n=1 Tax=Amphimedon queenslandica TaxID=400682 RepID=A0A1X7UI93_AMPQE|nr:PREDICTED: transducin beta-like protein 2 [Amphimedon queenslandica]|eukprot:XP_003387911.1 PREDICTED: transducin beta-like protein 2 [Amphimedon queenslandica]